MSNAILTERRIRHLVSLLREAKTYAKAFSDPHSKEYVEELHLMIYDLKSRYLVKGATV
jgi:hypothetical protein